MKDFGEFLGWVTVVLYAVSVCTFIVKRLNTLVIAGLPKESPVKKYYAVLMRFIVKYHMYFGIGAGAFAAIHYFIMTTSDDGSLTGTILAASMVLTVLIGVIVKMTKGTAGKNVLKLHRCVVMFVFAMVAVHLIFH